MREVIFNDLMELVPEAETLMVYSLVVAKWGQ